MNKRIKKKHDSILSQAIGLKNKELMNGVLDKLRSHGLTPHKIEFPGGYFLFMNKTAYEIMHFELKEFPDFYFGVWYKEIYVDNKDDFEIAIRAPFIFGERKCMLDKFKPSRTEWSPLYNITYFEKEREAQLEDFWSVVEGLSEFVRTPWKLTGDSEEEYKKDMEVFELRSQKTKLVLDEVYKHLASVMKSYQVDLSLLFPDDFFAENNFYAIVDGDAGIDILKVDNEISDYFATKFKKDLTNIINKLNVSEYVWIFQDEFRFCFRGVYSVDKDTLERTKTMSRTELNKTYNNLDIRTSNFVRLV